MGVVKDITGQKFGRLTALYKLHNYHKRANKILRVLEYRNMYETWEKLHKNTSHMGGCEK